VLQRVALKAVLLKVLEAAVPVVHQKAQVPKAVPADAVVHPKAAVPKALLPKAVPHQKAVPLAAEAPRALLRAAVAAVVVPANPLLADAVWHRPVKPQKQQ